MLMCQPEPPAQASLLMIFSRMQGTQMILLHYKSIFLFEYGYTLQ